jgi:hypothetical protein
VPPEPDAASLASIVADDHGENVEAGGDPSTTASTASTLSCTVAVNRLRPSSTSTNGCIVNRPRSGGLIRRPVENIPSSHVRPNRLAGPANTSPHERHCGKTYDSR